MLLFDLADLDVFLLFLEFELLFVGGDGIFDPVVLLVDHAFDQREFLGSGGLAHGWRWLETK